MVRLFREVRGVLVVTTVAAALGFGAMQAIGSTSAPPRDECPTEDPYTGDCVDHGDCQDQCDLRHGKGESEGICSLYMGIGPCCICILLGD
jgi:hypothetical protein